MKNNKGITLTALVIYIAVMIITLGIISAIITQFYKNTNSLEADTDEILQLNHFNTYFLKEVKAKGNKVDSVNDNYILFSSGNSFSLANKEILYNNIPICDKVKSITFKLGKNGDGVDNTIIYVEIIFNDFTKSMNYKLEEIY